MTNHSTRSFATTLGRVAVTCALALLSASPILAKEAPQRIVSVGGPMTELVFALGAGDQVIAVDTTSLFPTRATTLPKVGYQRALSAEGVLSLEPDLLLAGSDAGPPPALEQIRGAGVAVSIQPTAHDTDSLVELVQTVASVLGKEKEGDALVSRLAAEMATSRESLATASSTPSVLFAYARGAGTLMAAGRGTPSFGLIELAGAKNAIDDFAGYRPLSAEAIVLANPDVILVSKRGLTSLGGVDGLLSQPGVRETSAATHRRVAVLDDALLLGFGPRLATALTSLIEQIHGQPQPADDEE